MGDPSLTEAFARMQNLGATCYANSFLQVWYRDVKFREGVYSCLPPANGNVEVRPLSPSLLHLPP